MCSACDEHADGLVGCRRLLDRDRAVLEQWHERAERGKPKHSRQPTLDDLWIRSEPLAKVRRRSNSFGTEPALLVLDNNCEHLLNAVAPLVAQVLGRCPGVTVLAASREPLGIAGEHAWRVPPLVLADALTLLLDRGAGRTRPPARHRPKRHRLAACTTGSTACRWRSSSPRAGRRRSPVQRADLNEVTDTGVCALQPERHPVAFDEASRTI
ncbi:hypothetical protein [Pseudonocardia sp. TRM90224]|uniref:hypothetical protein n=1 Tax=Pseudonocardia sp. TRM90224 TaxID=2812678 RepID=UPI001E3FB395|nr:hypothetical protein [Pseudonocardia sp. TRM90224]